MFSHLVTSRRRLLDSVLLSDFVLDLCVHAFPGLSAGPPSDRLLDPPSNVTPFVLTALHRTVTFRSDRARPLFGSPAAIYCSENVAVRAVSLESLSEFRLSVRRRCVSIFHFFLTFLKRACSPGAVKNSKISKNLKFLDVRKTNGNTLILRCPDVVSVIMFFFFRFVNASCEKI